ncbi:Plasmodium variant antigen protein Cir/Yir/Bir, putative, partial [Plasmodium chabaudi chabaudi]
CEKIDDIEKIVVFDPESKNYKFKNDILNAYCPDKNCDSDELKLGSAFIGLLKNFKNIDNGNLEDDKLAQYATLWFSYKIKENTKIEIAKNTMYDILTQNEWFSEHKSKNYKFKNDILNAYCPDKNCDSDELKLGSAFIGLLKNFKNIDNGNLEDDKLAQYATLWFSYKIKENTKIEIAKNTMYDILTQNEWFSEHSESIDDKKDMMNFNFIHLKNLYELLKGICDTINKCSDSPNTEECIKS